MTCPSPVWQFLYLCYLFSLFIVTFLCSLYSYFIPISTFKPFPIWSSSHSSTFLSKHFYISFLSTLTFSCLPLFVFATYSCVTISIFIHFNFSIINLSQTSPHFLCSLFPIFYPEFLLLNSSHLSRITFTFILSHLSILMFTPFLFSIFSFIQFFFVQHYPFI